MNSYSPLSLRQKILIVDDTAINRQILCRMLSPEFEIIEAENGIKALEAVEFEKLNISVILLDLIMPELDGYGFLEKFKELPYSSSIPVLVQTQVENEDDQRKALSLGASDFVTKPFYAKTIISRVRNLVTSREKEGILHILQHDSLTQLLSGEYFYEQAKAYILASPKQKFKLFVSDFPNFKLTNDMFGIKEGNRILTSYARLLEKLFPFYPLSRLDSDVFAAVVPSNFPLDENTVKRLTNQLNSLSIINMTIPIKCCCYPIEDETLDIALMCDRARIAINNIKHNYGSRIIYYDDRLRKILMESKIIEETMESALENREFQVYLQPKFNLEENRLCGAEALVRWQSSIHGFLNPGAFIPIFERNGFITKVDFFVFEETCRLISEWDRKGILNIPVSVNLSRVDFYSPTIEEDLINIVNKYRISVDRVHIELTESAYTDNPEQIIRVITELKSLGFRIEMDDFGTGYSSLNMLSELPLDYLKLDMKFVHEGLKKRESATIIKFIITLSKWLNLTVIAEGIEKDNEAELLRTMGCAIGQGFLYSKPIPTSEFESLYKNAPLAGKITTKKEVLQETKRADQRVSFKEKPLLLSVDNSDLEFAVVSGILSKHFEIIRAKDGKEGLKILNEHRNDIKLVLMNLVLPEKDGYQTLEEIRSNSQFDRIPVLLCGIGIESTEHELLDKGGDGFVPAPYYPNVLIRKVQDAIRSRYYEYAIKQNCNIAEYETESTFHTDSELRYFIDHSNETKAKGFILISNRNLPEIIETYGHFYFETLVGKIYVSLKQHLPSTSTLYRLECDEIAVILENTKSEADLEKVKTEIKSAISEAFNTGEDELLVSGIIINERESFSAIYSRAREEFKNEQNT